MYITEPQDTTVSPNQAIVKTNKRVRIDLENNL